MKTIQPNTPAEQQQLLDAANRPDVQFECACIGNELDGISDGGWIDAGQYGPFHFQSLRYRIKESAHEPSASHDKLSERELLAIMSAIIFADPSQNSAPSVVVSQAKKLLHEIDNTTR